MPKFIKLARDGQAVECTSVELVRDASFPGGYCLRGITRQGAIARYPIEGSTIDGAAATMPTPDEQRDLAPERSPIRPGVSKAALAAKLKREDSTESDDSPAESSEPSAAPRARKRSTGST